MAYFYNDLVLLFLYRHVLVQEIGWLDNVVRAKRPRRLPVVLTRPEVRELLSQLDGVNWLMATILPPVNGMSAAPGKGH
jgi:integrase